MRGHWLEDTHMVRGDAHGERRLIQIEAHKGNIKLGFDLYTRRIKSCQIVDTFSSYRIVVNRHLSQPTYCGGVAAEIMHSYCNIRIC